MMFKINVSYNSNKLQNHNLSEEINQILLTIVPVHDVITCWIAQGVTKTIKVREMAAEHLDVVSHTLCSSKICCWDKFEFHYYVFIDDYFLKYFVLQIVSYYTWIQCIQKIIKTYTCVNINWSIFLIQEIISYRATSTKEKKKPLCKYPETKL